MGFLDSFANGLVQASINQIERQYKSMSIDQLVQEWNKEFENRSYNFIYKENSPLSILDRVYHERTGRKSWRQQYEEGQKELRERQMEMDRIEAEKLEIYRQALRESEEREKQKNEAESFYGALSKNEMVAKIIERIDNLGYDVSSIDVYKDMLASYDHEDETNYEIHYKKYGYPNLNNYQVEALTKYLAETLKLNYIIEDYRYPLDHQFFECCSLTLEDAPGGMKESW